MGFWDNGWHLFVRVAAAIELGAIAFLTFDGIQKKLAEAEGLACPSDGEWSLFESRHSG
jgi:hypothetical protein